MCVQKNPLFLPANPRLLEFRAASPRGAVLYHQYPTPNLVFPGLAFPICRKRAGEQPRSLVKQTLVGPREELGEKSGRVAHQIPGFAARVVLRVFLAQNSQTLGNPGMLQIPPNHRGCLCCRSSWGCLQEHLSLRNTSLLLLAPQFGGKRGELGEARKRCLGGIPSTR